MKICLAALAGCAFLLSARSADAVVINYDFNTLGTVYDNDAGVLSSTGGAGYTDVTTAFIADANAAATIWERALFGINQTLAITVTLADLTYESAVGDSLITSADTAPDLPSTSNIRVNDSVSAPIYVDATPYDNSAFNLVTQTANLNGNTVNVARFGTAIAGGPADNKYDLLSLFLHEDGHSLGFTDDVGSNYDLLLKASSAGACGRVDGGTTVGTEGALTVSALVTGNAAGFNIPVICSDPSHIDGLTADGLYNDATLADPGFGVNQRALITGLDILGLCAADGGTADQCTQNPSFADPNMQVASVPEPASLLALVAGVPAMLLTRRNRRKSALAV